MNVGSLFSGIGGLDYGLDRAGFEHAFLCESDGWRRGVLRERFPGVPVYDDVHDVGCQGTRGADGRKWAASSTGCQTALDLLCGGFPCQDLSVAGRRAGLQAGERSSLFFEFARAADELVQPGGYVLIENVPGLLSSQGGRDFAIVLATLAELGFHDLAWRILDSRHFGVPQRRRRVFVLARRCAGGDSCAKVLLESAGGDGNLTAGRDEGEGVASASTNGTRDGGAGVTAFHPTQDPIHGPISPALGVTTGGMNVHASTVRRLTPIECERLQGLPDDWTRVPDDAPDSRRYAGLGDAVTSPVGYWIGRRLLEHVQVPA